MLKNLKAHGERSSQLSQLSSGNVASSLRLLSKTVEGKRIASTADQYAIMVSCRCNYTGIYIAFSLTCLLKNYKQLVVFYYCHFYLTVCVECRVKVVFQAANKMATPYLKGSYDLCCI